MIIRNFLPGKFYKLPKSVMEPTSTKSNSVMPLNFDLKVGKDEQLAYKGYCQKIFWKQERKWSLALLSSVGSLNRVSLVRCKHIKNSSLKYLARLSNLRYLSLNRCYDISDEGIKRISNIPLRSLFLDCTSITNRALEYIKEISNLQYLGLFYCDVNEEGLQFLDSTPLKYLSLEDCSLNDGDLKPLSSLTRACQHSMKKDN